MNFNERLKQLRGERGITQDKLAEELDIPASSIRRLESDEDSLPRKERLEAIADYFKVSVDYLMGRTDEKTRVLQEASRIIVDNLELSDEELMKKINFKVDNVSLNPEDVKLFLNLIRAQRTTKKLSPLSDENKH